MKIASFNLLPPLLKTAHLSAPIRCVPGKGVMPDGTSRFTDAEGKPIWHPGSVTAGFFWGRDFFSWESCGEKNGLVSSLVRVESNQPHPPPKKRSYFSFKFFGFLTNLTTQLLFFNTNLRYYKLPLDPKKPMEKCWLYAGFKF